MAKLPAPHPASARVLCWLRVTVYSTMRPFWEQRVVEYQPPAGRRRGEGGRSSAVGDSPLVFAMAPKVVGGVKLVGAGLGSGLVSSRRQGWLLPCVAMVPAALPRAADSPRTHR